MRESQLLAARPDTRERLVALYRERDESDAVGYATGSLKMRGTTYAIGLARLESGEETYESYGVIAAAGVQLPQESLEIIASLPQDWSRVCRIDSEGRLWTASLREKQKLVR